MNELGYVAVLNGIVIPFNRITSFRANILEPNQYAILVSTNDKDMPTKIIYPNYEILTEDFERVTKEYNLYKSFELKEKNSLPVNKFVKIKGTRIRLDSVVGYQYVPSRLKIHYVRINDCDYECDSEKEARDFIKKLDELLGVK